MHIKPIPTLLPLAMLWLVASTGCTPEQDAAARLVDQRLEPVARAIIRGEDRFAVADLARALIEDRQDLLVVDLRPADSFAAAHIKGAENRPLDRLLSEAGLADLPADRMLVLYADRTAPAAQAAALLRLAGLDAYALDSGYQGWLDYVRNPEAAGEKDAQARAERQAVACYFEGDYVAAAGLAVRQAGYTPPVAPVEAPVNKPDPAAARAAALGLGLGLGLGPTPAPKAPQPVAKPDTLGLGLGLGLGPADAPKPAAATAPPKKRRLKVDEGC